MSEHGWVTKLGWFLSGNSQVIRDIALTLAAIVGLPLVIWRTWATHRQSKAALQQAETASQRHEQQTDADRQRRITESFARAIEQLGSEKLEVRLGAIYALERIARESRDDHWSIMETLTAFVRERAPVNWNQEPSERPASDVQAVINALRRREQRHDPGETPLDRRAEGDHSDSREFEDPDEPRFDLSSTTLVGANLKGANLRRADLSDARLGGANLTQVDLRHAMIYRAALDRARLANARLDGATLEEASLIYANLRGASLAGASLASADLRLAQLTRANLSEAFLGEANLQGADLREAKVTQEQLNQAYGDAKTKLPEGLTIPFRDGGADKASHPDKRG